MLIIPGFALPKLDFYNHKDHLTPKADKSCGHNCFIVHSRTTDDLLTRQSEGQKITKVIPVNKKLIF